MHTRPHLCLFIVAFAAIVSVRSFAADATPPNIILIMADDVGYEAFGAYGSKQYRTPNLDRLAANGVRFEHCYAQPLCTPSRVKIMTGLSNVRNYSAFTILNRGQNTFAHVLKDAGYRTMVAGKWQLYGSSHYTKRFRNKGTLPRDAGFDQWCLWQVDQLGERFFGPLMNINGTTRQFPQSEYGPEVATNHILRFIDNHHEKPFFVYYPMILVHSPFVPTPDSANPQTKNKQKNFEDMVAYMDTLVGRIVDRVEHHGLSNRTLIIFTGDNGAHGSIRSRLGSNTIIGGKGKTTDAGTRVPLIARWPGVSPKGRVVTDLIDLSDFLPTLADVAGAEMPEGLDGVSFLPQIKGQAGNPRPWLYQFYHPRPETRRAVRFVRDQRWKLYGDGRFYNVAIDPLERSSLKPARPDSPAGRARTKLAKALKSMPAKGQMLLEFPK